MHPIYCDIHFVLPSAFDILRYILSSRTIALHDLPINLRYIYKRVLPLVYIHHHHHHRHCHIVHHHHHCHIVHPCHLNDDNEDDYDDQAKATWTQLSSLRSLLRNVCQAQTSFPGDPSHDHGHADRLTLVHVGPK